MQGLFFENWFKKFSKTFCSSKIESCTQLCCWYWATLIRLLPASTTICSSGLLDLFFKGGKNILHESKKFYICAPLRETEMLFSFSSLAKIRCHSSVGRAKDWKSLCPRFDSWWHHRKKAFSILRRLFFLNQRRIEPIFDSRLPAFWWLQSIVIDKISIDVISNVKTGGIHIYNIPFWYGL